ncbi:hypothetical protein D3C71_2109230 [compost metagenome]
MPRPDSSTTSTVTSIAAKKRRSTACISGTRTEGSSVCTAGRRKKCENTMPPSQTMTASRWMYLRGANSMEGLW